MKANTKTTTMISLALLGGFANAATIIDDFNDGNDNGWTRYDPIGAAIGSPFASFSFPNGNSYRMQAPESPNPAVIGPARAGAYRADISQTNFVNTIDVINWESGIEQSFGLVARAGNFGPGMTTGYVFMMCDLCDFIAISRADNEQFFGPESDPDGDGSSFASVNIDPANAYRLVFTGIGSSLTGEIYDLSDLTTPLATVTATDTTYTSGNPGLLTAAFTTPGATNTDTTFDNFSAIPEPTSALLIGMSALLLTRRQRRNA